MNHTQLLNHAVDLFRQGHLSDAEHSIQTVIDANKSNQEAYRLMGVLQSLKNNNYQAIICFENAINLDPNNNILQLNLAKALTASGRHNEAMLLYKKITRMLPRNCDAWFNYGYSLMQTGYNHDALGCFDKSIEINSLHVNSWVNRGVVFDSLKKYADALACFVKAIEIEPDSIEAWLAQGVTMHKLRQYTDALASYEKALILDSNNADAWGKRGTTLTAMQRYDEGIHAYEKVLTLNPDDRYYYGLYLHSKMMLCDWDGLDDIFHSIITDPDKYIDIDPCVLLGTPASPLLLKRAARHFITEKQLDDEVLYTAPGRRNKKITIGYYSADYHNHATSYLLAGVLECHDRNHFEIICFSYGPDIRDEMRSRIMSAVDQFIDVRFKTDNEVAELSRHIGIDIAVDLKGFTADARIGIFACHAAPIQVNSLGYPGTLSAPFIDYIIADHTLIDEQSSRFYDERIVYLPGSYLPYDNTRKIADHHICRLDHNLPEHSFVFCSFNNTFKITPDLFDVWMRLLRRVPESFLWLLEGDNTTRLNLVREARRRGVSADRLIFAPRMAREEHLARISLADLFLDSFYYNGHATAGDALRSGLPVLTCMGSTFASRVASSLLDAVGLPDLIAHSVDEYESLAIELASNAELLKNIRTRLMRNILDAPQCNTKQYTIHIETAYKKMHEIYMGGLVPKAIVVDHIPDTDLDRN